jgi:hypothetical protein
LLTLKHDIQLHLKLKASVYEGGRL